MSLRLILKAFNKFGAKLFDSSAFAGAKNKGILGGITDFSYNFITKPTSTSTPF